MENKDKWVMFSTGAAILISLFSIFLSYSASDTANKTQELQVRPWLLLSAHKNDSTGRYYDIIENGDSTEWVATINIENKGVLPQIT